MSADDVKSASVRDAVKTKPELQGRWLTAVRIAWTAASIGILALTAAGFVGGLRDWELFGSKSIHTAITAAGLSVTAVSVLGLLVPHVIYAATGILIFARRSRDWRAMLFALTLIAFTALRPLLAVERAVPRLSLVVEAAWLLALFLIFTLLFIFPDGRFVPSWTRYLMLGAIPAAVVLSAPMRVVLMLPDQPPAGAAGGIRISVAAMLLYFGVGLGAQVYRFRTASDIVERQQIKWVGFAISTVLAALLLGFAVPAVFVDTDNAWFAWGMLATVPLFLFVPVAVAVAIFRYQLFAIDRIISRTLTYTALTLVLAAVYASTVVVLARLTGARSSISVAGATLVVAAVFRPVQRRLQDAVDRRFNRRKYNLRWTVEQFEYRLRDELNATQLERELIGVVQKTLQPVTVSLWAPRTAKRRHVG